MLKQGLYGMQNTDSGKTDRPASLVFLYFYLDVLPKSTQLYRINKFNLFPGEAGSKLR